MTHGQDKGKTVGGDIRFFRRCDITGCKRAFAKKIFLGAVDRSTNRPRRYCLSTNQRQAQILRCLSW